MTADDPDDGSAASGDRSATSEDGSAASGDRSATSGDRSAASGDRSATSGDRPDASGDRSATSGDRPDASGDRSATSGDRLDASAERPAVAVFRPADERLATAVDCLDSLGVRPVADPMLAVEPTGATPRPGVDVVAFTSRTGAELVADAGWTPDAATVAAIGPRTADALRAAGFEVDVVPDEYSSAGLVAALADGVAGASVEVARSDHGSPVLLEGLADAGAEVHETVLYELSRPPEAGDSAELAAAGDLAGALFTSSLTVEHFLAAAAERGVRDAALAGLDAAVVGAIGDPTAETAREHGVAIDVVPERTTFEALARGAVAEIGPG